MKNMKWYFVGTVFTGALIVLGVAGSLVGFGSGSGYSTFPAPTPAVHIAY